MSAAVSYYTGGSPSTIQRTAAQLSGNVSTILLGIAPGAYTSALVLEVVAQPTNLLGGQVYIELTRNNSGGGISYLFSFQDLNPGQDYGILSFGLYTQQAGYAEQDIPIRISDYHNKLLRFIARYDGGTKYIYTCAPGGQLKLLGQQGWSGNTLVPGNGNRLGSSSGDETSGDENFGGLLSDFRRWSVDRSPAQLQQYAFKALPHPASQPGLEAYYRLNEPAGSTLVRDSSAYHVRGQITNGALVATPTFIQAN